VGKFGANVVDKVEKVYPFVSMSVLNLTSTFVKSKANINDLQEEVRKIVKESVEKNEMLLKELHCAVYLSIGYSDFVVLFMTKDIKKTANIISGLKGY